MKGLILKDFLSIKKELKLFLIAGVLYILFALASKDATILALIGIIASMSAVSTSMSYDEKANFYSYAKGIKLDPKDVVLSKYTLGILVGIVSAVISVIVNFLLQVEVNETIRMVQTIIIGSILIISLQVPVYLKAGVEKGKFVNMGVTLLPAVVIIFFKDKLENYDLNKIIEFLGNYGMILIGIVIILISIISILISIKIYKNKEFS